MKEQENRREAAIQILARMDIYAEEMFGKEFPDIDMHKQIDVIEALLNSGVISKSEVTYM